MNAPNPYHWTLNSCFGAFLFVQVHLGQFRYCTKLGAKRAKLVQLMQNLGHDVLLEFLATNTRNLHYWIPNSCFGAFLSIRMYFGLFLYCTKLGAKAPNWCN